jgi:hypothetical protein
MGDSKRRKQLYGAQYYDHAQSTKRETDNTEAEVLMEATPREILAEARVPVLFERPSKAHAKRARIAKEGVRLPRRGIRAQRMLRRALEALGRFLRWAWLGAPRRAWTFPELTRGQLQMVAAGGIGTSPSDPNAPDFKGGA